jgi:hypothetical protein
MTSGCNVNEIDTDSSLLPTATNFVEIYCDFSIPNAFMRPESWVFAKLKVNSRRCFRGNVERLLLPIPAAQ